MLAFDRAQDKRAGPVLSPALSPALSEVEGEVEGEAEELSTGNDQAYDRILAGDLFAPPPPAVAGEGELW